MSLASSLCLTVTPPAHCDSVWRGATLVTMQDGRYNVIENGALAVTEGKIVWRKLCRNRRGGRWYFIHCKRHPGRHGRGTAPAGFIAFATAAGRGGHLP